MKEEQRPDPDQLLEAIQRQESHQKRGKLKIFLGMAAGVGKTYALLEAARKQQSLGVDVVAGYVETHGRKETDALLAGLVMMPRKVTEHRGVKLSEMDVDALLARKPKLALIDELAHTNVPGSRHPKRYQDVLEVLDAGIDVYTTLNVQHVESRAHTVEDITGSAVHETVPDSVLDLADIELIDIAPDDLMRRLDEGKVYMPDRAAVAMVNFFREGNLKALREMALRLAAERVGQDVRDYMQVMQIQGPWKTGHRLLVAVSPSPLSAQMVRWTRRLADSLDAVWLAVHVESSASISEADQERLTTNLALARELGAEVIATADENLVRGVLRVARQHNVTQIVVGKPVVRGLRQLLMGRTFLDRLVADSGDIDIHVVRADKAENAPVPKLFHPPSELSWKQYSTGVAVVAGVTALNAVLNAWTSFGYQALALNFLLGVAILALFVGRGPVLASAALSALCWDFFFVPPPFTFYISKPADVMMFLMYFVVAIVLGQLIARVRAQEKAERRREERTNALYLLTRELADAVTLDQISGIVVKHVGELFHAEVAVMLADAGGKLSNQPMADATLKLSEKEHAVASWVFEHNQPAGQFTTNLPLSEALYVPLTTPAGTLGVIGVRLAQTAAPSLEQTNLLEAFARQASLVIDRQRLHEVAQESHLAEESERLSRTLLDSISHEMRTPIAAITGAASGLSDPGLNGQPGLANAFIGEIKEAVTRLNRLVGNLLDIARVESGHVTPKLDWCDVGDLVNVTVKSVQKELTGRKLDIMLAQDLPLVRMDFTLMEQALTNLLLNAAVHTSPGTSIRITASAKNGELALSVADKGARHSDRRAAENLRQIFPRSGRRHGGNRAGIVNRQRIC